MKVWAALTSFCPPKCLCGQLDLDLTNQNNRHQFSQAICKIRLIKIIKINKYGCQLISIIVQFIPLISNSVRCGINKVNISLILIILN